MDGHYQGALFRMTQGLEAGVSRVLTAPDGSLVVGGLGAGGNWGQNGKLRYGLQKLDLNGNVPFDMKSMGATRDGFEITYTKPLSAATLEDLAPSTGRPVALRGHPQYGGPKLDEETSRSRAATACDDRRTVTAHVDGMKPDRVVHLRSPRPFAVRRRRDALEHRGLVHAQQLPRHVATDPEPAPDGIYELEDGELTGTAGIDTEHAGYTGSGFVDGIQSVARPPLSRSAAPRRAPTTCRSATPTARTRSRTRPRR